MNNEVATLKSMYKSFNERDVDGVLAMLSSDVSWANGMDGGHVEGHEGIRAYWTRQWALANPHVEPVAFHQAADGSIVVEVNQTIRDQDGNTVQVLGLKDKTLSHVFHFKGGKVRRFDLREE
jgi:hypothetical protein